AAADPANIDAQFDLGIGYSGVAELLARTGDNAGALDHFRKGLAVFEKITTDNPDNAEMKSYLADSLIKAGRVYAAMSDTAKAMESVNRGRVILEALSSEDAANVEMRTALADSYLAMGDVEAKMAASNKSAEHHRAARSWYQQSMTIYDDLRRRDLLPATSNDELDELT